MTDKERIDWLARAARRSRTGVSMDFVPADPMDGTPQGWRFMRYHFIGPTRPTIREAIDEAKLQESRFT